MKRESRVPASVRRAILAILALAFVAGLAPSPAAAFERIETYGFPSTQGNIDLSQNKLNATDNMRLNVILPDGYDEQPDRKWPVIYMLHGIDDNADTWYYALATLTKQIPAILVLPEGGKGFYTDEWINGTRKGSNWERYFLQEIVPTVNRYFRILPGRSDHAIVGNSMGGQGALILGAELPGYFGSAASFSGLLTIENPFAWLAFPNLANISYTRYWGPFNGPYSIVHSADRQMQNLQYTNTLLTSGNGVASSQYPVGIGDKTVGGAIEVGAPASAQVAYSAGKSAGVPITLRTRTGIHAWEYWRDDIDYAANTWGLFRATPISDGELNTSWRYRTMATTGNAWGLGYSFAKPPTDQLMITRNGQRITTAGGGKIPLTISPGAADDDASGAGTRPDCTFTATPPFVKVLPDGC